MYFFGEPGFIFVIFTSVAPHRSQPAAKYHPRWQPTRRLAVSCGLGRHRIQTRDCRTTVWHATIELPHLPKTKKHIFTSNLLGYIKTFKTKNLKIFNFFLQCAGCVVRQSGGNLLLIGEYSSTVKNRQI